MNSKIPILALTANVTTVDFAKCKLSIFNAILHSLYSRLLSGLWVQAGKIKCGVFGSACEAAKHLY